MKSIRCIFGIHTGIIDSTYKYISHRDSKVRDKKLEELGYGDIVASFEKRCGRCGKKLKYQNFAFGWYPKKEGIYENMPHSKIEAIEKAMKFITNKG